MVYLTSTSIATKTCPSGMGAGFPVARSTPAKLSPNGPDWWTSQ
jgi:hypothetical protein